MWDVTFFKGNKIEFMIHGFEKTCTKFNKKYGSIVQCWLNGEKILVISDPELFKYISHTNGTNYLRRFTSKEVLHESVSIKELSQ